MPRVARYDVEYAEFGPARKPYRERLRDLWALILRLLVFQMSRAGDGEDVGRRRNRRSFLVGRARRSSPAPLRLISRRTTGSTT